jgi:hypothetical protein
MAGNPRIFLEGGSAIHEFQRGSAGASVALLPTPGAIDLDRLDPARGDRLLVDTWRRDRSRRDVTAAFETVPLPLPPPILHAAPQSWDFEAEDGWRGPASPARSGRPGVAIERWTSLYLADLTGILGDSRGTPPATITSPPLRLLAAGYCRAELLVRLPAAAGGPDERRRAPEATDSFNPSGQFGALLWSGGEGGDVPWESFVILQAPASGPPAAEPSGAAAPVRMFADLSASPTWRRSGLVRRLAILPSNLRGRSELQSLRLVPCERRPSP